jgi:hypothetical protein
MARVKGREHVTFAIAPEVLVLIDAHAKSVGLDRYDAMRLAIAKGVLVLRMEHEALMDGTGIMTTAMLKAVRGEGDPAEHMRVIEAGIQKGLERDVPEGPGALSRKRVRSDGS